VAHEIGTSAEEFWSYRLDLRFDELIVEGDGQVMRVERWDDLQDAQGHAVVDRTVKLTFKKNPVPKSLRGLLNDPEFAFEVSARWHRTLFDKEHAMAYSIKARRPHRPPSSSSPEAERSLNYHRNPTIGHSRLVPDSLPCHPHL